MNQKWFEGRVHIQWLIPLQFQRTHSLNETIPQVVGLATNFAQDVQIVFINGSIVTILKHIKLHFEGLIENSKQSVVKILPPLTLRFGYSRHILDLGASCKAEKALKIEIENPNIPGGHQQVHSLICLDAETDRSDIDPD